MENLNRTRRNFKSPRNLTSVFTAYPSENSRHTLNTKQPRREVRYLSKKETRNTSKICHRCEYVTQVKGRTFKCPSCGIEYNRDLNIAINIAHALTRRMG